MSAARRLVAALLGAFVAACATPREEAAFHQLDGSPLSARQVDRRIEELMTRARVPGLALGVVQDGRVAWSKGYGFADVAADRPMATDTVLYGASLAKAAFATMTMQLVTEGRIDLDKPVAAQLTKPIGQYPAFADLAPDARWLRITPRMLLSHTSGLLNWRWINDDKRLDIKFEPGTRYVYSGEGIQLLQLLVEERTGEGASALMQSRVFDRYGMPHTSMTWRDENAGKESMRYTVEGQPLPHDHRSRARAAGSMDTTLDDMTRFAGGLLDEWQRDRPEVVQMFKASARIASPRQFPSHWPGETTVNDAIELSAALGWVTYRSRFGPAVFKEGNDDGTNNVMLLFPQARTAVVMLSNSARADRMFYPALEALLGPTCLPWFWMSYVPYDKGELRRLDARDAPLGPSCR